MAPAGPRPKGKSEPPDEIVEEVEPEFTGIDTDDSCDVPIEAVVEHVVFKGKAPIEGVVELEDGGLVRVVETKDPDIKVPEDSEEERAEEPEEKVEEPELRRGKRARTSIRRLHDKDWEYTHAVNVPDEPGQKKQCRG